VRISIGSDQAGFPLKEPLVRWLTAQGHEVDDRGGDGREPVDYPPICADVGGQVAAGAADRGIILGGSGLGETIAANKVPGVRATLCQCLWTARIARTNNDANVLVLGAKVIAPAMAEEIAAVWLTTEFTGGRHVPRLSQIAALERGEPLGRPHATGTTPQGATSKG
jgi:ribose 5-phosphate isomerase B